MLPPLASVDDLEAWTDATITNSARAEAILSAASTLVRIHTGRLWVNADDEPDEGVSAVKAQAVKQVVVMVADRVYNNPRGTTQQTAGPFSHSVASWAALGMSLTADEKAMLSTSGVQGLGSVRVVAPALARWRMWGDEE